MYYKITNKNSSVYQQLNKMRSEELAIEEENRQAIKDRFGLEFETFLGYHGQQNFGRVSRYLGFKFSNPEKVDPAVWKQDKENEGIFLPNKRTKVGREAASFLYSGLRCSYFNRPFEILGLEHPSRFTLPFVEICGETIILMLDNRMEPQDSNVIEITKKEFNEILKSE